MKRLLIAVALIVVVPVVVFAASNAVMVIQGIVGPTTKATLTDTARAIDNVVGGSSVYVRNSQHPIAATISVETKGARFACGGTTPTVDNVGHVLAADASMRITGASAVRSLKLVNAVAGDNSVVQITLEY